LIEIKVSGRGGQGAVMASQILASSFFENGMFVQSFPSFGAERRGAPVSAFVRADSIQITLRCGIQHADWLVLFEPNLLENQVTMSGTTEKTSLVVNSAIIPEPLKSAKYEHIFIVDGTAIAQKMNLKTTSFPIINTAMVGAFAKVSNLVDLESVDRAIRNAVPFKKEENVAAATEAYKEVRELFL